MMDLEIHNEIMAERKYQDLKWGDPSTHTHTVGEFILVLEKNLADVKKTWHTASPPGKTLNEILQLVAVGVACMEQHGVMCRSEGGTKGANKNC